jgi:hypothetical protein
MKLIRRPSATPLWRDEFAIHQADERYVNRRQFAKFLVLTSLGMVAGNVWIAIRALFHRDPVFEPQTLGRSRCEPPILPIALRTGHRTDGKFRRW